MRKSSLRSASLLVVLSALAAAPKPARAGVFTFVGSYNSNWNYLLNGAYANWLNGQIHSGASYDDEIHLGLSTATSRLASNMNFSSTRLGKLVFDQKGGVDLTGNAIRFGGGGSIAVTSAADHTMTNAVVLNDNAATANNLAVDVVTNGSLLASGVWSGTGALIKTGGGTLTLSGANAYSGGTTIRGGTVKLGNDKGIGTNGNLTLLGGSLDLNGSSPTVRNLTLGDGVTSGSLGNVSGAGTLNLTGNLTFQGVWEATDPVQIGAKLSLAAGQRTFRGNGAWSTGLANVVFAGGITGAGGISFTDSFFALTGKSDYEGPTDVYSALYLGATNVLPTNTAVTVLPGAYLRLDPQSTGGGLTAGSYSQTIGSLGGGGTVRLGSAALTVGGLDRDTTFSGVIEGAGSLVKTGLGVLTLSGRNAFSGGTTINGGTIKLGVPDALANGDLTLAGGDLDLNGFSTAVRDLYLGDASTGKVGSIKSVGQIRLNGNLTFRGAQPVQLKPEIALSSGQHTFGGSPLSGSPYGVVASGPINGPGGLTKQGSFALALTGQSGYTGPTNVEQGDLFLGATNALPTNTALTLGSNGRLGLSPETTGDGVTAGSYSQTVGSLDGSGTIQLGSATLTVGGLGTDSTFSGVMLGEGGSLVKTGPGLLTLKGTGLYSGGTTIQNGWIRLESDSALLRGDLTLAGGNLDLGGHTATVRNLHLGDGAAYQIGTLWDNSIGTGSIRLMGDVAFQGRADRTTSPYQLNVGLSLAEGQHAVSVVSPSLFSDYSLVFGGPIGGMGGLDVSGSTIALTNENSYAGATNVKSGALVLGREGALPTNTALTVDGALSLRAASSGNGVWMGSYSQTVGSLAGAASGRIHLGSATLAVGGKNADTEFAGILDGEGGKLVKTGTGVLLLSGPNAYSGGTTIKGGTIKVGSSGALAGGDLTLGGGSLDLNGASVALHNLNLGDGLTYGNMGTVLGTGTLDLSGDLTLRGAGFAPVEIGANFSLTEGQHTFTQIDRSGGFYDLILSGEISGAGGLNLYGTGSYALTGKSAYAGATNVNRGDLYLGAANALPANTALTVDQVSRLSLSPWATEGGVTAGSYSQTVGSLAGAGQIDLGSATLTVGGLNVDTTFEGIIRGMGSFVKTGTGTLTLSGLGDYTGGTAIRGGSIRLESSNALPILSDLTLAGGSLDLNGQHAALQNLWLGDGASPTIGGVSGAGTLNLGGAVVFQGAPGGTSPALLSSDVFLSKPGQSTFVGNGRLGGSAYDLIVSGGLSGVSGLDKVGDFRLVLAGKATYEGGTTVAGGELILARENALPTNTALTVVPGATLSFNPKATENGVTAGSYAQTVGSLSGGGRIDLGSAALTVGGLNLDTVYNGAIVGEGSLVKVGTGALVLSGMNFYSGGTTVESGRLDLVAPNALSPTGAVAIGPNGTLNVIGDQTFGALTGSGTVNLNAGTLSFGNGSANAVFSGVLNAAGSLVKDGAGRADFTQANLNFQFGSLTVRGGTFATTTAYTGPVSLENGRYEIAQATDGELNATLTGSGELVKTGTGVVRVGNQSFIGRATVSGGGLVVESGTGFAPSTGVSIEHGASLRLEPGAFVSGALLGNSGELAGSGTIVSTVYNNPDGRIVLNGDTMAVLGSVSNFGRISGQGVFQGVLGLSNFGTIAASGGTLTVLGTVANTGLVSAPLGSTVSFQGEVTGSGFYLDKGTVEFDGGFRPGNSPARVSFEGDLKLGALNALQMELGGLALGAGYDHLDVAGTAFLGGALDVVWYGGFAATRGQSFDLFNFNSSNGTFSSISLPTLSSGLVWNTSALYTNGTISVQAVPEPATWGALALGAVGLMRRRKRQGAK